VLRGTIFALALATFASAAGAATLSGPMQSYAWFPGRWACRTVTAGSSNADGVPAKLWVVVDGTHDALKQYFSMTSPSGKPYRSDDVLTYDAKLHAFVRRTLDVNGAQTALVAKAPYKPSMEYVGVVGLQDGKLYRMRATVGIDATRTLLTTATAFWHADTKSWVVQTTGACSKVSN
jgi:hypothetical protein